MHRNNTMKKFFLKFSLNKKNVAVAEIASVYHTVKHHQSYHSLDCYLKLQFKIYSDLRTACQIHCRRTKAEVFSVDAVKKELKSSHHDDNRPRPFSINTDASNKRNKNIFCVAKLTLMHQVK